MRRRCAQFEVQPAALSSIFNAPSVLADFFPKTITLSVKVMVLVDARSVPEHVRELMAWAQTQAQMQCSVILLCGLPAVNYLGRPGLESQSKASNAWTRTCLTLLWSGVLFVARRRMRSTQFKGRTDSAQDFQAIDFRAGVTAFEVLDGETPDDHFHRLPSALRASAPDVIVQCSSLARVKEFAACARHGVIDVAYGNNPRFRGRPPGFWEVFYRTNKTGFLIRQWSAKARKKSKAKSRDAHPALHGKAQLLGSKAMGTRALKSAN